MNTKAAAQVRSDACVFDALITPYGGLDEARTGLVMRDDWASRWTTAWQVNGSKVLWPVRDLGSVPVLSSKPVRGFTWRTKQRHRPGLEFLVSTGRMHGFESLEEKAALLALDFMTVIEVLPQPFTLRFEHADGHAGHTPDFLAVMGNGGHWLLDVRPAGVVGELDAVKFAASGEVAAACGWRYSVIVGWRPHVLSGLDALSAQRRPLTDQLGCQPALLAAVADGPVAFGELVQATRVPAVGRAHAVHLLWHRRLGFDLGRPLGDSSLVWPAGWTEFR
ncbi:TnsA-like heteromeric transposase endonuclease subunit [Streptomyces anulatus]|uniref:TnsA-like heteromeric transposase endonuclease subunit n=1 Tax=Streptomyces TaxID=1883 RepID=UPI00211D6363|nr:MULTISPECIES: TnsA-like heteromeric transposase endonuclease subunit [Streptomyces]MCX4502198.1 TnsA-like heteromeric transposase endonuclease subunit [Streptomyces anulatus]WTC75298.1 TnsA-like heteromeric transposase endonuclease subunit [Streptomyces anulatus]WUD87315.1 TnsA-like heteromeric transposase endonuclease subunit [Streptomyces anulatus]